MTLIEVQQVRSSSSTGTRSRGALPAGFRFHPTDEELILHYLRRRAAAAPCPAAIIAEVDIYKLDPWELPAKAVFGGDGAEWYFFSPRERKYPNGVRPNRAAGSGYWKATGTDKPIFTSDDDGENEMIGVKKALVFYQGRPPKGMKTNWIMHEYRLADGPRPRHNTAVNTFRGPISMRFKDSSSMRLDDWVLCRIYNKTPVVNHQLLEPFSSSMDMDHHQQQEEQEDVDNSVDDVAVVSSTYDGMPRPPSISDYLEDYSAVSDLFDNLPPQTFFSTTTTTAGHRDQATTTSRKRQTTAMDEYDYNINNNSNDNVELMPPHASKRLLISDAYINNNTFSIFGAGQPSQDTI